MADTPDIPDGAEEGNVERSAQPLLRTLAQYIQDLSFEVPNAPESLRKPPDGAKLEVNVNVDASPAGEDLYEVLLKLEATAGSDDQVIYTLEMIYGGVFALKDIPQEMVQPALFIDCAALLFPFARRILADLTRESGFPPLLLDPIDFSNLYRQRLEHAQAEQEKGSES